MPDYDRGPTPDAQKPENDGQASYGSPKQQPADDLKKEGKTGQPHPKRDDEEE